jgi:uncharacterized protein YecE (DUF72 family)
VSAALEYHRATNVAAHGTDEAPELIPETRPPKFPDYGDADRLPLETSVAKWVEETPTDFLFAVKASRYLTHIKRLTDLGGGIARYYERIEPLVRSPKLGPVLWQLPATFRRNDDRLANALAAFPPGRHAFEFRHASWFTEPVYDLLRAHGAALVIGDRPEVKDFQAHEFTTDWTFVRFHYGSRGRRGNYSERELEEWARRFEEWSDDVEILAYFNNDWEVFAVRNALWLKHRLEQPSKVSARS